LNKNEAEAVQVQLILIYRFIQEDKYFKKFYGKGLEINHKKNKELERILACKDADQILKSAILELEEIKTGQDISKISFDEILSQHNPTLAYRAFKIKGLVEVDKLDLNWLGEIL
jgi:hypothetical protein